MTKKALVNKQAELNGLSKEIKTLSLAKDKCNKAAQTASLEARKVSHRLKQWEGESKNAAKRLTVMLKQHPWIEKEKQFFGVAGSDFEFCSSTSNSNVDAVDKDVIGDSQKRLAQLKLDQVCSYRCSSQMIYMDYLFQQKLVYNIFKFFSLIVIICTIFAGKTCQESE